MDEVNEQRWETDLYDLAPHWSGARGWSWRGATEFYAVGRQA